MLSHAKLIVEPCDHLPDGFTARDIYRRCWRSLKDNQAVKQALELLCRCNYIREFPIEGNELGRRPDKRYEWHPLVKNNSIKLKTTTQNSFYAILIKELFSKSK